MEGGEGWAVIDPLLGRQGEKEGLEWLDGVGVFGRRQGDGSDRIGYP